ncbi:MAG: tRNA-specific adenosine deaminase [Bacteroidota bacterium]|jgi:tRNA(adenine34) deaminase
MTDEYFMQQALREAMKAFDDDEVPIGAVIVCNNTIIGKGYNQTERLKDATAHAEMIAITAAENYLGNKYLHDCTLYVTVEPCVMCAGASAWTQVSRVVYGAAEEKFGFTRLEKNILHPKTLITKFVLQNECADLMKKFFQQKRN